MANCNGILIVEDDLTIRETIKELLEMEGFSVATAQDGKEGIELLKTLAPPCMILLDLMMPVMNGQEFLEALRKEACTALCSIPIIVVSAVIDGAKAKELKVTDYIRKPINLDKLVSVTKQYCDAPS